MMSKQRILLSTILFAAIVLRFWRLGSYPALNADEAAIGYNAHSLIETGMDEHGNRWPIHFQSFNDYKPGLYFYLVMPLVRVMGLNIWAVRIPGAALGVASVLLVYWLVEELFNNEVHALAAAAYLAISPWHLHFSRGGWEVNTATFFIILGVLAFLKGKRGARYYSISVLAFVASLYTYHAARVVVPLLSLGLVYGKRRELKKNAKNILWAGTLGGVFLVPLIWSMMGPGIGSRAAGVSIFADEGVVSRINEQRGEHGDYLGVVPKLLHNKPINYGLELLENWVSHYWGEFLFLSGDEIERNRVPETGQMFMVDVVFVIFGLWMALKKPKNWGAVFWWLAVAPVAAAMTFQSPHALRAHNMVVPLIIISSYGLVKLAHGKKLVWIMLMILIGWNFIRYQMMYWIHMAKEYPYSSQYGVQELVSYVVENEEKYENVVVTDRYDQPYILFLFYLKYPPAQFQSEHELVPQNYGFSTVRKLDKYRFVSIDYEELKEEFPDSMFAGTDEEIYDESVIEEIYGLNGYKYFEVVEN